MFKWLVAAFAAGVAVALAAGGKDIKRYLEMRKM
jgi:hypothetical protein